MFCSDMNRIRKVWAIRRMRQNFLASVFQIVFNSSCNMRASVVIKIHQTFLNPPNTDLCIDVTDIRLYRSFGFLIWFHIWFFCVKGCINASIFGASHNPMRNRLLFVAFKQHINVYCQFIWHPNFFGFECIRLLLNVFKWPLKWLPKILWALLVLDNNLHCVSIFISSSSHCFGCCLQHFSSSQPKAPLARHKVQHNLLKIIFFTL